MFLKPEDPYRDHDHRTSHPGGAAQLSGSYRVLTQLLYDIALAGKVISSQTNRAGLAEILGRTERSERPG